MPKWSIGTPHSDHQQSLLHNGRIASLKFLHSWILATDILPQHYHIFYTWNQLNVKQFWHPLSKLNMAMHVKRKNVCWSTALCHESKSKKPIYGTFHIVWYCWTFYSKRIGTKSIGLFAIFHWLALDLNLYKKMDSSWLFQWEKHYRNVECNDA
jgi:hypothetical protein